MVPVGNHDCTHQDEFLTKAPNHHKTVKVFFWELHYQQNSSLWQWCCITLCVWTIFYVDLNNNVLYFVALLFNKKINKNIFKDFLFLPRSSAHPLNPAGGAQSRWPSWPHAARGPPCGQRHQGGCRCCSGCSGCSIPAAARRCSLHITSRAHQLV